MKKIKFLLRSYITLLLFTGTSDAGAQLTTDSLMTFVAGTQILNDGRYKMTAGIRDFYKVTAYQTAWIKKENNVNLLVLLDQLKLAGNYGLSEKDYQYDLITDLRTSGMIIHESDSLETELLLTDAALHFYSDIAYGNSKPILGYNGLSYQPGCMNIPNLLAVYVIGKPLQLFISNLYPSLPEISVIEQKIQWFNRIMKEDGFSERTITSPKTTTANKNLIIKLYQLGILEDTAISIVDSTLKQKTKEAQKQFGLLADGILRGTTLQALNIPLSARLKQLVISVNYYRWLHCLAEQQPVIVVNIPATILKVYHENKVILEMRVIVGKKSTSTPTLASKVEQVVLYPYWHVPYSIATKEILPAVKRNPGYINTYNYQVLNMNGKIMDPYSINWHALSAGYFPYLIRQSTGCDNALGLIKLDFYSPFGVYLHDTPGKGLFMLNKRFFSHGCMRMEKPMELGHLVLKDHAAAIDTLEQKGCLRNQSPIFVPADEKMPVIVWYNPAGIDASGRILYFEDVYGKLNK